MNTTMETCNVPDSSINRIPTENAMKDYHTFLQTKRMVSHARGIEIALADVHARLFPFQRALVQWALRKGRAALFADCGLGKTYMQLVWANAVSQHSGSDVLILAPLAVASQTIAEGEKLGIAVRMCRSQADCDAQTTGGTA